MQGFAAVASRILQCYDERKLKRTLKEAKSMKFENKVCVITGGALGIGRCLTQEFARLGAKVAFVDMDEKAGKENLELIRSAGAKPCFPWGYRGRANPAGFCTRSGLYIRKGGLLDQQRLPVQGRHPLRLQLRRLQLRFAGGSHSPYFLSLLLLPHFNAGASIVNIASTRAFQSQADTESYTAAKGGISALTHALAASLAGRVRVNAISPGWIDTGRTMIPLTHRISIQRICSSTL